MSAAKKGLGRGLNALLDANPVIDISSGVVEVDITKIEPNKNQPRKYFDEESIEELSVSLKEFGLIQPIIVKKETDYYSIIAGERRFRAARIAKFKKIPVIIKDYSDLEIIQIALIENIQRKDLNPIEEAQCFKRLIDEYLYRQEDIANKVGKSRPSISASLKLLNLNYEIQNLIIEGNLTSSHGRLLLNIIDNTERIKVAEIIIENSLSIKQAEKLIQSYLNSKDKKEVSKPTNKNQYRYMEDDLKTIFGTKVNIKHNKDKGKIEIEYYSNEELDRLLNTFRQIKTN